MPEEQRPVRRRRQQEEAPVAGILPDRPQPHAENIERAVLAALIRDASGCLDTARSFFKDRLTVFYSPSHREIYNTIVELGKEDSHQVDLLSVAQRLREKNKLEAVGGELYLAELEMTISTTVNIETWCKQLVKYDNLRQMIGVCSESMIKCYDADQDADSVLDEVEKKVFDIRSADMGATIYPVKELLDKEFQELMKINKGEVRVGLKTGFDIVDEYTGGLKPGEMFILAARPSIGKTSLALNIIRNVATGPHGVPVAFFSLEMTEGQIVRRLLCTQAGVPEAVFWNRQFDIRNITQLTGAAAVLKEAQIYIDPTGGLSIAELRAKARRMKMVHNIELAVIDYIGLMTTGQRSENRQAEIQQISGAIKKLAKELQIPFLVLAQLNREVDKNSSPNAKPKLANLRDSGSIEQDADVVTFLHRDREKSKGDVPSAEALWIIEKNRNGRTGDVKLNFIPSRMEFQLAPRVDQSYGPDPKEGKKE
jgi:replicative DNA helicase